MLSRGLDTLANEIKERMKRAESFTPEVMTAIACVVKAAALEARSLEWQLQRDATQVTLQHLKGNVVLFPGPPSSPSHSRAGCAERRRSVGSHFGETGDDSSTG